MYFLAWIRTTARTFGDFLRNVAELLLVFVPLDYIIPGLTRAPLQRDTLWHLAEAVATLFVIGLICEYIAVIADRVKRDWENR